MDCTQAGQCPQMMMVTAGNAPPYIVGDYKFKGECHSERM